MLIVSWQRAGVPETLSPASFDEARRWEAEVRTAAVLPDNDIKKVPGANIECEVLESVHLHEILNDLVDFGHGDAGLEEGQGGEGGCFSKSLLDGGQRSSEFGRHGVAVELYGGDTGESFENRSKSVSCDVVVAEFHECHVSVC